MTSNLSEHGYNKVLDFSERTKFICYIIDQLINNRIFTKIALCYTPLILFSENNPAHKAFFLML